MYLLTFPTPLPIPLSSCAQPQLSSPVFHSTLHNRHLHSLSHTLFSLVPHVTPTHPPPIASTVLCVEDTTDWFQEVMTEENTRREFYESSEDTDKEEEAEVPRKKTYSMDVDHRLLLHTCKPLLNSRNAAVSTTCLAQKC